MKDDECRSLILHGPFLLDLLETVVFRTARCPVCAAMVKTNRKAMGRQFQGKETHRRRGRKQRREQSDSLGPSRRRQCHLLQVQQRRGFRRVLRTGTCLPKVLLKPFKGQLQWQKRGRKRSDSTAVHRGAAIQFFTRLKHRMKKTRASKAHYARLHWNTGGAKP